MTGSDGVLAPMMKRFLELMMAGELDHYPSESKRLEQPNRKNGKSKKTVRSLSGGEFELETGTVETRSIYNILGVDIEAEKDVFLVFILLKAKVPNFGYRC